MADAEPRERDRPWLFRTYAGHSSAAASNALFKKNLERGQTGLSVAFDLPTQLGLDSDDRLAAGEVGKVGAPIGSIADMRALMDGIPLDEMNVSMTINATAPWLLALYVALADERGIDRASLAGTVQNDLIKEFLSRGSHVYPPEPSMRLMVDVIAFCHAEIPKWNPTNVCSYHLQEAGATPVQELAFALATAIAVLDAARERVEPEAFPTLVGRVSFFVNAGLRFVTEMCKMRAFTELWDEIARERYGVEDPKLRRFRYGVQVNSLGLTEQQPENNVHRILLETLAVTLSKNARARAVQLPAWNEALGLPRPWDQQWSLRMQQILAFETDLLEFPDLFDGSPVIRAETDALKEAARAELDAIAALGGAIAAIEDGYMKRRLVEANAARVRAIASGEQIVVGVNAYQESEPSPLTSGQGPRFMTVDASAEAEQIARLQAHRAERDDDDAARALDRLRRDAAEGRNVMPASIDCARAGVTTGEWGDALRGVFGEYRAPTGIEGARSNAPDGLDRAREKAGAASVALGRPISFVVGKPGLDGHSNGAEQIAVAARDCGMDAHYAGIRCTPEEIALAAREARAHVVGLSILSGAHVELAEETRARLDALGLGDVPLIVGGIIPEDDGARLGAAGVSRIYSPKHFDLATIMEDVVDLACRTSEPADDSR